MLSSWCVHHFPASSAECFLFLLGMAIEASSSSAGLLEVFYSWIGWLVGWFFVWGGCGVFFCCCCFGGLWWFFFLLGICLFVCLPLFFFVCLGFFFGWLVGFNLFCLGGFSWLSFSTPKIHTKFMSSRYSVGNIDHNKEVLTSNLEYSKGCKRSKPQATLPCYKDSRQYPRKSRKEKPKSPIYSRSQCVRVGSFWWFAVQESARKPANIIHVWRQQWWDQMSSITKPWRGCRFAAEVAACSREREFYGSPAAAQSG